MGEAQRYVQPANGVPQQPLKAQPPQAYPAGYPYPYPYPPHGGASAQVYMVPAPSTSCCGQQGVPVAAGYGHVQTYCVQPCTYWPSHATDADCPSCRTRVTTRTHKKTGLGTWLISLGTCFVGCICGCCLIPFAVDECKDTIHKCPKCGRTLGEARLVG